MGRLESNADGQPRSRRASLGRGIRNTTGVTITSMGANGAALTSYDPISNLLQSVCAANGEPSAIIYSPRTAGALDRLKDTTNQPLRQPPSVEPVAKFITANIPENLTQGSSTLASEVYVGEWGDLLIGMRRPDHRGQPGGERRHGQRVAPTAVSLPGVSPVRHRGLAAGPLRGPDGRPVVR